MAVKSIIDIELNDEKFKAFKALYDKYEASLAKMPSQWGKVATGAAAVAAGAAVGMKQAVLAEMDAEKSARRHAASWQSIARSTKDFASNIRSATVEFAKWTGIIGVFSGLLGAGGLFGIERLAGSVAANRRTAGGLGVSYGQNQAFNLNFKRFVDADSMLANVSNALHDFRSRGYVGLLSAGISPQFAGSHNAAEVSAELLHRIPQLFKGTPTAGIGARLSALQLDDILSQQDVIRYLGASPQERAKQEKNFGRDVGSLDLDPSMQRAWNDFMTQMERAGGQIENTFVRGLVPLEPSLEKLSASFESFVSKLLGSDLVKTGIDKLSSGLNTFADYVTSADFEKSVESFVDGIKSLAKSVVSALQFLGVVPEFTTSGDAAGVPGPGKIIPNPDNYRGALSEEEQARRLQQFRGGSGVVGSAAGGAGGNVLNWSAGPASGNTAGATEAYIRQAAIARGIDPNVAVAVARSEGLNRYTGDFGSSFGPFQLHYGGVDRTPGHGNAGAGLGDAFTSSTGLDARDPATTRQQVDYALHYAMQHGWGPWHGWHGSSRAGLPHQGPHPAATSNIRVHVDNAAGASVIVSGDSLAHGP